MDFDVLKKIITWVLVFGGIGSPLSAMLPRSMTVSHSSSSGQHKDGPSQLQRLMSWFESHFGPGTQHKKSGQLQVQHTPRLSKQRAATHVDNN